MEHISYLERSGRLPDFEVPYKLYTADEGGRKTPAYQGIRWDFMYDDHREILYIIHPEILNVATNESFASETPIPEFGKATMWIVSPQFQLLHRQRIKMGTRGFFMEGPHKMAVCEVTRIIGLFENPVAA